MDLFSDKDWTSLNRLKFKLKGIKPSYACKHLTNKASKEGNLYECSIWGDYSL